MTQAKPLSPILATSPWIPAVLFSACVLSLALSFWAPAFLEWQLAVARMESGHAFWPDMIRAGLLGLGMVFALWFGVAKMKQWLPFEMCYMIATLGFFVLAILGNGLGSASPNYKAVAGASSALSKMSTTEQALGRTTPAGDELRASVVSLGALRQNRELLDRINTASNDPNDALEIMAVASLLGSDHPVIQFTANNGLVAENAREVLYRDLMNHIRQRPDLANDATTSAMLMRLSAR